MRLIDLSQPVFDDCPNCPAHPRVRVEIIDSHAARGVETWHMELLTFASHTGSHVDAPLHKIPGGASLDDIPLERWHGRALIVDMRGIAPRTLITAAALAGKLPDAAVRDAFVLIATGWGDKRSKSSEWLHDAPAMAADGAKWLVDREARGVGIDYFSIGDASAHAILLSKPVLIVEELHFPPVAFSLKQPFEFQAFPINLRGQSGAPCRPVLLVREDA